MSKSGEVPELSATSTCVLGALVHLAEGMLRIVGSSPLVPLRSEYYLEYKVCVYLWW